MVRAVEEILAELEAKERGPIEPYISWSARLDDEEKKHPPLTPYERKGRVKLLTKFHTMRPNYSGAIPTAKEHYGKLPFGPITRASFNASMDAGADKEYSEKIITSLEKKWAVKWMAGISR